MEESELGKLIIIGTGQVEVKLLDEKYPAVAVWLFEGLQIDLNWEVFTFRFSHEIGPRRIGQNARQMAQSLGGSKLLEIGEALLPIESILAVHIQSHGFVALCEENANMAIISHKLKKIVHDLFAEEDNLQIEIAPNSRFVMGQFLPASA